MRRELGAERRDVAARPELDRRREASQRVGDGARRRRLADGADIGARGVVLAGQRERERAARADVRDGPLVPPPREPPGPDGQRTRRGLRRRSRVASEESDLRADDRRPEADGPLFRRGHRRELALGGVDVTGVDRRARGVHVGGENRLSPPPSRPGHGERAEDHEVDAEDEARAGAGRPAGERTRGDEDQPQAEERAKRGGRGGGGLAKHAAELSARRAAVPAPARRNGAHAPLEAARRRWSRRIVTRVRGASPRAGGSSRRRRPARPTSGPRPTRAPRGCRPSRRA